MSARVDRVSALLEREIAQIISRMADPRLKLVTVTGLKLSPDLKQAEIYFSLLDESKEADVERCLSRARGFLRHELSKAVRLRFIPELSFKPDQILKQERHIQKLLKDLNEA
jgi:ribosome-binding factor A